MEEELKISKEKILEAASVCPNAKLVLQKLFPNVFKKSITKDELLSMVTDVLSTSSIIQIRDNACSNLNEKAFFLSSRYNWCIKKDNQDMNWLVPTFKD